MSQVSQKKITTGDPIATLALSGVSVRRDGDRLFVSPPERVTDKIQAFIRANRAAILDRLDAERADDLVKRGFHGSAVVSWVIDPDAACGRDERPREPLPGAKVSRGMLNGGA